MRRLHSESRRVDGAATDVLVAQFDPFQSKMAQETKGLRYRLRGIIANAAKSNRVQDGRMSLNLAQMMPHATTTTRNTTMAKHPTLNMQ